MAFVLHDVRITKLVDRRVRCTAGRPCDWFVGALVRGLRAKDFFCLAAPPFGPILVYVDCSPLYPLRFIANV